MLKQFGFNNSDIIQRFGMKVLQESKWMFDKAIHLLSFMLIFCFMSSEKGWTQATNGFSIKEQSIGYSIDFFDDQLNDWHNGFYTIKVSSSTFDIIPKATLARRFDQDGLYFETDLYAKLKNGDYVQFDGGFSLDEIFPSYRAGVEYYNVFKKIWEHSFGIRYFNFEQTGGIVLLNKSLSHYWGKNYSSIRGNLSYTVDEEAFTNFGITARNRYYRNDISYWEVFGAYGFDTSVILIGDNTNVQSNDPYLITAGTQYHTSFNNRRKWIVGYTWTRYEFPTRTRNQHTLSLSFSLQGKG